MGRRPEAVAAGPTKRRSYALGLARPFKAKIDDRHAISAPTGRGGTVGDSYERHIWSSPSCALVRG
eukprot:5694511-Prymnesium_polylepis.2